MSLSNHTEKQQKKVKGINLFQKLTNMRQFWNTTHEKQRENTILNVWLISLITVCSVFDKANEVTQVRKESLKKSLQKSCCIKLIKLQVRTHIKKHPSEAHFTCYKEELQQKKSEDME